MTEFRKKIIFGENGRSIATYYSSDLAEIHEYVSKGWSYEIDYKGKGYWLRAPDEWVVDMTDPFKIYYYGNPVVNLAYYKFLKHYSDKNQLKEYVNIIIKKNRVYYKDFEFEIADGLVLQSEIRIIGSDSRVKTLKRDMFKNFVESTAYEKLLNYYKNCLGEIRDIEIERIEKNNYTPKIKDFYNKTNFYLKTIGSSTNESLKVIKKLVDQLPEFDVMILIPRGCFKFINSIVNDENVDKVMLYEMHVNSHVNKSFTLYGQSLKNKKVLIVDQIYSGKTLQIMKDIVIQQGGIPRTLGMFPKSTYSFYGSDYVAILDNIIKTNNMEITNNWIIKSYKQILKKGD